MERILINFEYQGKNYSGYFNKVAGAGDSTVWHLYDDKNYYLGRLRYSDKWVFDSTPTTKELAKSADFFADYLTAWIS